MGSYICVICQENTTNNLSMVCSGCDDILFKRGMKFFEENDNISKYTEERLYEDLLLDDQILRIESVVGSKKSLDKDEEYIDKMSFFIKNKKLMEKDFIERLANEIGEKKAIYFCDLIRNYWYDEGKRKSSKKIKGLKNSINKFLKTNIFVVEHEIEEKSKISLISEEDIGKILDINRDLFNLYLEDWIEEHPLNHEKNTSNIFFLRGLNLDKLIKPYKEKDYINSYTLSLSMAEQFSDMGNDRNIIISGEYGLFYKRILFFSPFIPKPDNDKEYPEQLEIGIIPHTSEVSFEEKEYLGGVRGYKLYD